MKGDYYRYLVEVATSDERQSNVLSFTQNEILVSILVAAMSKEVQRAYMDSYDVSKNGLPATHPIRLGLALSSAVWHYEVLNQPDIAYRLAKQVRLI